MKSFLIIYFAGCSSCNTGGTQGWDMQTARPVLSLGQ